MKKIINNKYSVNLTKNMRHTLTKLGRAKVVIILTLIAMILAVSINALIAEILHHKFDAAEEFVRAVMIPLLIAPILSWHFIGFMLELDQLEQRMHKFATYDELTGLLTRRAFFDSCDVLHKYSIRNKQDYSLLYVDLDFFKKINDKYGHDAGDKVLKSFGKVSRALSRDNDIIGRLGGEEFVFFLPNTDLKQAKFFAQRLNEAIKHTKVISANKHIAYTVSMGIAKNNCNKNYTLDEILKHSDIALYTAKKNGRNQIATYENEDL